jgi:hypothetical protein
MKNCSTPHTSFRIPNPVENHTSGTGCRYARFTIQLSTDTSLVYGLTARLKSVKTSVVSGMDRRLYTQFRACTTVASSYHEELKIGPLKNY